MIILHWLLKIKCFINLRDFISNYLKMGKLGPDKFPSLLQYFMEVNYDYFFFKIFESISI